MLWGDRSLQGGKAKPGPCVNSFHVSTSATAKGDRLLSTRIGTGCSCCLGRPYAFQPQPYLPITSRNKHDALKREKKGRQTDKLQGRRQGSASRHHTSITTEELRKPEV